MIFNVPGHIEMIRNGLLPSIEERRQLQVLPTYPIKIIPEEVVKTQTRRLNRGIYKVGKDYAVQKKRGVKAEPDIRIVMDRIWKEDCLINDELGHGGYFLSKPIPKADAQAEGGYISEEVEKMFREINPNWNGIIRYGFEFHVIEVYTKDEKENYRKFDDAQKELDKER